MKILSISFGFNGSLCLMDDGKVIKHTSFNKINYGNDRDIIKPKTLSLFLENTGFYMADVDYIVFSGFDRSKFKYNNVDFVPEEYYKISNGSLYSHPGLERKPIYKLPSLLPPFTEEPYDYIKGHFIFKEQVIPSIIVSPDMAYTSYGYYSSDFNRSLNITVNSNDFTQYDGSMVSISKGNNISVIERPKVSVGKLYPKMTELLGFGLGHINTTTLHDISTRYHIPKHMRSIVDNGVDNKLSNIRHNYELSFFFEHSTSQFFQNVERHKMIPYSSFEGKDVNSKYVLKTAALTQRVLENTVIKLIRDSVDKYSGNFTHSVTLSGDVFENRRLNTKILQEFTDIELHIPPYNKVETQSMGAAMYVHNMFGNRRVYSRDFLLSTTPYNTKINNLGDEIDYDLLDDELTKNIVSFNYKSPECTQKSMGYTGLLFDVDSVGFENNKDKLFRNLFEKPILLIREDKFNDNFIEIPYTLDNNTVAKPKLPHMFRNFIHDDGYLNLFVINEKTNPSLYSILKETKRDYVGFYNFENKDTKHIILTKTIFEIVSDLGVKLMIIDNKQHIKDDE